MATLLIFFISGIGGWIAPWWSIAPIAFIVGFFLCPSSLRAFFAGFAGVGILWAAIVTYIHWHSQGVLTAKIATMMFLPSPLLLIVITAVIGGSIAGLSAISGFRLRCLLAPQQAKN